MIKALQCIITPVIGFTKFLQLRASFWYKWWLRLTQPKATLIDKCHEPITFFITAVDGASITQIHHVQWNLVIKRSDITKPSYNKVFLLVPAHYIYIFFLPWYNKKPDIKRYFSWSQGPRYNKVPLYSIQMANNWSCNGTRFRMRRKIRLVE